MPILKGLFKHKKEETVDFAAEAEKVLEDQARIDKLRNNARPDDRADPLKMAVWCTKRLKLLRNSEFHPVARLTATDGYGEMISDYAEKLNSAAQDNKAALKEVLDTKAKVDNLLQEETKRLEKEIDQWKIKAANREEYSFVAGGRWNDLKNAMEKDMKIAKQRVEMIVPRDKEDMYQWKSYYIQRVKILERDAINIAARTTFTAHKHKKQLIQQYKDMLDRLIAGENDEKSFHVLESKMNSIVAEEAKLLRKKYPRFFDNSVL